MHLIGNDGIETAIPKFHLPAHKAECHSQYSLNYRLGVGRTDGEAPERVWVATNGAANSTKEMKEGHRHDTLDDVINDINWQKISRLGEFT
jgi:glucan biosynthesis protein